MLRSPKFTQRNIIMYSINKATGDNSAVALFNNVDFTANSFTYANHGFVTGDRVQVVSSGFLIGPAATTDYWVIKIDNNSFKLATSLANAVAGTTQALTSPSINFEDGDVTVGSESIEEVDHGFVTGDKVQLTSTGTLPAGLALATDYYVIRVDANNFKLASSAALAAAGTAVDITAAEGGGVHTATLFASAGNTFTVTATDKLNGLDKFSGFSLTVQATGKYRIYLPEDAVNVENYSVQLTSTTVDQVPMLYAKNVAYFDVWVNEIDESAAYVDGNFTVLVIKTDADLA
jgi:hypothetical protein